MPSGPAPSPRALRILVCPQEFKGTLPPAEAAAAIAEGLRAAATAAGVEVAIRMQPVADGGPGTLDLVAAAVEGAERVTLRVTGPLGEPLTAGYLLLPPAEEGPRTAVIEAAATAGLALVAPARRDPGHATTSGVGAQIRDALLRGARRIIIGVGGTATNDGGAGALQALGYRLLDAAGQPLPPGGLALDRLDHADPGEAPALLRTASLVVATDVTNPLVGIDGATMTFGAQKLPPPGDDIEVLLRLEQALLRWAMVAERDLLTPIADRPGGGAGGGLAAGLLASVPVSGAHIESGAAMVGAIIGLDALIEDADLVVTGEGSLDAQTAHGKSVAYVAERAAALGRPCLAVAGRIEERLPGLADAEAVDPGATPAADLPPTGDAAIAEAAPGVAATGVAAAARLLLARYLAAR